MLQQACSCSHPAALRPLTAFLQDMELFSEGPDTRCSMVLLLSCTGLHRPATLSAQSWQVCPLTTLATASDGS